MHASFQKARFLLMAENLPHVIACFQHSHVRLKVGPQTRLAENAAKGSDFEVCGARGGFPEAPVPLRFGAFGDDEFDMPAGLALKQGLRYRTGESAKVQPVFG